jgi:hypothetical protein
MVVSNLCSEAPASAIRRGSKVVQFEGVYVARRVPSGETSTKAPDPRLSIKAPARMDFCAPAIAIPQGIDDIRAPLLVATS